MAGKSEEPVELRQRALQFLVHSFLYYRLGESIVSDEFFDQVAEELRALRSKHPEAEMPYAEVIDPALGPEASGFRIRKYPPRIISTAFKLLYAFTATEMDFPEFLERRGFGATFSGEATEGNS